MTLCSRPIGRLLTILRLCPTALALLCAFAPALHAVSVHGTVTDPLGYPIANATVALVQNGDVLLSARTGPDGGYAIVSPSSGRFYVLASGISFRQLQTLRFYGGRFDNVEQNVTAIPKPSASPSSSPPPELPNPRRRLAPPSPASAPKTS